MDALQLQPRATPSELVHLPTSVREQIRTVPSLHIPSEQSMIRCKQLLADTHATATGTFVGGAYISDPIRFVSVVCAQSSLLVVGGDAGGGHTKLGVTYIQDGVQHFAALLVYEGGDSWVELQDCRAVGLTPYVGDSATFPHIWAVMQHLIDTRGAFLNGDWCFINAVLGLMAPSAMHPCPICIINKNNLCNASRYRTVNDKHSRATGQQPLLTINPDRIVPTPLHLFLGISNRIILDVYAELFSEQQVASILKPALTLHSPGCGGLGDVHDLTGPEVSKWLQRDSNAQLLAAACEKENLSPTVQATFSVLSRWLHQLHNHLLHKSEWTLQQIEEWRAAVDDIQKHWCSETGHDPFPKLHMLRHALEFAERHRFLGRASEAQIESFHAQFNALFHKQHRNQAGNTAERLRRSLADAALRAVQPMLSSSSTPS